MYRLATLSGVRQLLIRCLKRYSWLYQVRDSQQQFDSMDKIIDVLSSVKNKGFMDQLLFSCFCVVSINKSEQGANALSAIFSRFGYSDDDCVEVIKKINALGQMFR